jgi:hypothetical protein
LHGNGALSMVRLLRKLADSGQAISGTIRRAWQSELVNMALFAQIPQTLINSLLAFWHCNEEAKSSAMAPSALPGFQSLFTSSDSMQIPCEKELYRTMLPSQRLVDICDLKLKKRSFS